MATPRVITTGERKSSNSDTRLHSKSKGQDTGQQTSRQLSRIKSGSGSLSAEESLGDAALSASRGVFSSAIGPMLSECMKISSPRDPGGSRLVGRILRGINVGIDGLVPIRGVSESASRRLLLQPRREFRFLLAWALRGPAPVKQRTAARRMARRCVMLEK
jgi:hypothetical protein